MFNFIDRKYSCAVDIESDIFCDSFNWENIGPIKVLGDGLTTKGKRAHVWSCGPEQAWPIRGSLHDRKNAQF